ncbi:AAA family ATPase [Micromonospora sp. NPDC049051]|uniref:AAA family ATPase n=1 Tax=Micromonospora sp. NPDC049051 TaxID=3364264 RepID=UPI003710DF4B
MASLLTALSVFLAGGLLAISVNAASNVDATWPYGLEMIRRHPFRWAGILLVIVVVLSVLVAWLSERPIGSRPDGTGEAPVPHRDPIPFGTEKAVVGLDRGIPWTREAVVRSTIDKLLAGGPPVVLVGLPGSGKTVLLAQVTALVADRLPEAVVISFDGPAAVEPGYLHTELNRFLRSHGINLDAELLQRLPDEVALKKLAAVAADLPVLLVLDGLDWLDDQRRSVLLRTFTDLPRLRVLATARRRPPPGDPAVVVHVEALSDEEAAALAERAVGYLRLAVDSADVLAAAPAAVRRHPRSLLFALARCDRLPSAVARRQLAAMKAQTTTVQEMIKALPEADRVLLFRLLPVVGIAPSRLIGWSPVFSGPEVADAGFELLRSAMVEMLEPEIRISELVQEAALAVASDTVALLAQDMVHAVLEAGPDEAASAESIAAALAYRLEKLGFSRLVVRICQKRSLLDRLNHTGRWDDYLALVRIGARAAESVGDLALAAEMWLRLSGKLPQRGDVAGGEEALQRAEPLVGQLPAPLLRSRLASQRGLLQLYRGAPEQALRSYLAAIELADDAAARCVAHKQLGHVYEMLGDSDRALLHYEVAAAEGAPDDRHALEARIDLALASSRRRSLDEANEKIRAVLDEIRGLPQEYPAGLCRALLALAVIAWRRRERRTALTSVRMALTVTATDPRLRVTAYELLRRWQRPWWRQVITALATPSDLLRGIRAAGAANALPIAAKSYEDDVRQLYEWQDRSLTDLEQRTDHVTRLRGDFVAFALGTGADREAVESIFHDVDTRTIELISG